MKYGIIGTDSTLQHYLRKGSHSQKILSDSWWTVSPGYDLPKSSPPRVRGQFLRATKPKENTMLKIESRAVSYELYSHKNQGTDDIIGFDLCAHLRETGFIDRALSLVSEQVEGWFNHPSTYPEELRKVYPVLWRSVQDFHGIYYVPVLSWTAHDGDILVRWSWLGARCSLGSPALLAR